MKGHDHDEKSCEICCVHRMGKARELAQREARLLHEKQRNDSQRDRERERERQHRRAQAQAEQEREQVNVTLNIGVFFDGTGNNAANVEDGLRCGAHYPVAAEDLDSSCKPYMSDPESSYGNDVSNIKRLFDLYESLPTSADIYERRMVFGKIYIEGIGTQSGQKDSLVGSGVGRGETGVAAKVEDAFNKVRIYIKLVHELNPKCRISQLKFDVFGFSRGAVAARHFANQAAQMIEGPLRAALELPKQVFASGFSKRYGEDVQVGFIGLFDSVAAVGGVSNSGNIRSASVPGLKLHLPRDLFPRVVHLVARDEYRANFALRRVKPDHPEIVLPGAHSDIGGGYRVEAQERVLLSPMQALDVPLHVDVKTTSIYRDAEQEQAKWLAKGWPIQMLNIITPAEKLLPLDPQDRLAPRQKRVFAALQLKRTVRGELSRVYLRVMHALAKRGGAEFIDISDKSDFNIPPDLQTLCDRFVAGDYRTTPAEEEMLRVHYIHISAHWNPMAPLQGLRANTTNLIYINAPAVDGIRVQHPHI